MAKKPFDEELNFREDPQFIFDTDPMDLGRYSHEVPTSENTENMIPDRALSGMSEQSDEEIGAEEMNADDTLMAEIAKQYAPKEEVLPEIGDRDLASAEPSETDKLSGLLAQYKSMQQPETTTDSGPNLEMIAAAQKIGQSMAGRYSGNFKPDTEVIQMLQKRRDTKEAFDREKPSRDLKQLMDMYKLKKLQQGPEAKVFAKNTSKDWVGENGEPLVVDQSTGGFLTTEGKPYDGTPKRYIADMEKGLTEAQKIQFGLKREELDLKKSKDKDADKKELTQIAKENRKEVKVIDGSMEKLRELKDNIKKAIAEQKKYSSGIGPGTGPWATGFGLKKAFSEDTQMLDSSFQKISLSNMAKMFEGMSKAVDSDAERAKFEASQPSITNDDKVNVKLLKENLDAVQSLINKNNSAKSNYLNNDTADKIMKSQEMPQRTMQQGDSVLMRSPNGETVRVKKDQVQKYKDKGAEVVE